MLLNEFFEYVFTKGPAPSNASAADHAVANAVTLKLFSNALLSSERHQYKILFIKPLANGLPVILSRVSILDSHKLSWPEMASFRNFAEVIDRASEKHKTFCGIANKIRQEAIAEKIILIELSSGDGLHVFKFNEVYEKNKVFQNLVALLSFENANGFPATVLLTSVSWKQLFEEEISLIDDVGPIFDFDEFAKYQIRLAIDQRGSNCIFQEALEIRKAGNNDGSDSESGNEGNSESGNEGNCEGGDESDSEGGDASNSEGGNEGNCEGGDESNCESGSESESGQNDDE